MHKIESNAEIPDVANCKYVTGIAEYDDEFYYSDSDYVIFICGIDMLRENIEHQKENELNLQRDKKMLLLSLSHDIKTPLSAIKLYSKALSKGLYANNEKQIEIAESINAKADEIESYVCQIITASREEFLSLDVQSGEFHLSEQTLSNGYTLTHTYFNSGFSPSESPLSRNL